MLWLGQIEAQHQVAQAAQAVSAVAQLRSDLLHVIEAAKIPAAQAETGARFLLIRRVPAEAHQRYRGIPVRFLQ